MSMNSFSIAFSNFKRNIRIYGLYIFSMIFSVIIYYNFVSLKYNPDFIKANQVSDYIKYTSISVSFLLLLFIIFFIWYSSSFFQKQRKREIGIYAFMGVTNSEIGVIYSLEVLFIGTFSIIVGLVLGILFCKLFLMMLAKAALLNMTIRFFVSGRAIIETVLTFFAVFAAVSVFGYINIVKSKLIDLFSASKIEESLPKLSYMKGILSIAMIGCAYYFARGAIGANFGKNFLLTLVFIILGTYFLFESVYSIIMKAVVNNKKILYKGVNIVSLSNISFRIKNNYKMLSVVAILVTITLTSYGTVASLKYFTQVSNEVQTPYSLSYTVPGKDADQKVSDILHKADKNIALKEKVNFILAKISIKGDTAYEVKSDLEYPKAVVRYSDLLRVNKDLKSNMIKEVQKCSPKRGEAVFMNYPGTILSLVNYNNIKITYKGNPYVIKHILKAPLFGNGVQCCCIILNDEDYDAVKGKDTEYKFTGIRVDKPQGMKALKTQFKTISEIKDTVLVSEGHDKSMYSVIGIVYFLGAFLAVVFIIATGSIIYFKLVSEAYMDKDKYTILKRLGMTKNEAEKSVVLQIGVSYILPLIVGIVHSCVAISVLSKIMNNADLMVPAARSIIAFAAVYAVYFMATTMKYLKIVY